MPDQPQDQLQEEFIALCQMADEAGMRAVWTGEHHGMDFTIAPNPLMSLVNLAHHTKHIRLGTVTIVAPFWHPIKLAGEARFGPISPRTACGGQSAGRSKRGQKRRTSSSCSCRWA